VTVEDLEEESRAVMEKVEAVQDCALDLVQSSKGKESSLPIFECSTDSLQLFFKFLV
jgi:hypothetical protein